MGNFYHLDRVYMLPNNGGSEFFRVFLEKETIVSIRGFNNGSTETEVKTYSDAREARKGLEQLRYSKGKEGFYCPHQLEVKEMKLELTPEGQLLPGAQKELEQQMQDIYTERSQGLAQLLEMEMKPTQVLTHQEWSRWDKDWEWRKKIKPQLLEKPHYYLQSSDELLILLDFKSSIELQENDRGFTDRGWLPLDLEVSPELLETAIKLWEPLQRGSIYYSLIDAFKAAGALEAQ